MNNKKATTNWLAISWILVIVSVLVFGCSDPHPLTTAASEEKPPSTPGQSFHIAQVPQKSLERIHTEEATETTHSSSSHSSWQRGLRFGSRGKGFFTHSWSD